MFIFDAPCTSSNPAPFVFIGETAPPRGTTVRRRLFHLYLIRLSERGFAILLLSVPTDFCL